ncbi:hypothetical protein LCM20_09450 [Halobacillus litoralis]|uniref:hypothetical protein n=1 Tax=Halobacillus litoralis TaxID=45668 RepID=UPI001CD3C504|nr:hypothetical protein [Halobacillus litoralis]MCA0970814.1 hypothetical protein [Halobacillus litoralis]
MSEKQHPLINTNMLDFIRNNVYSVTEMTRQKKLSEILELYSGEVTDEVFIVQNGKKKDAQAVIADLEYFEHLLTLKEEVERAFDQVALEEASERVNDAADLSLSDVFEDDDIDVDALLKALEEDK